MAILQERLAQLIPELRKEIKTIVKEQGQVKISDVTIEQAYGGMRGVKGLICDTSVVEPDQGLIIRGNPLLEIRDLWPEDIFYLLLTGDKPDDRARAALQMDLAARSHVPDYVWDMIDALPPDSHPMAMLNAAILVMERESVFRAWYDRGMKKDDYWIPMLEDALRILGVIPVIAAGIYRIRYEKGDPIEYDPALDWGANYVRMLGLPDDKGDFAKLMRLYLNFHSDHEGGNVSAFTCHTVGSALSDAFYAVSAGLNGLAGPLHGLANQECLGWILDTMEKFGGVPTENQLHDYALETLNSGRVVPGYGHAVLRVCDPRFTGFIDFGNQYLPDDPVFKTVALTFKVMPEILQKEFLGADGKPKVKDPWPNVDAGSGALLYHYGLTEFPYYTVLFSVSRAMGMLAQLVLNRAIGTAITRPKSVSTAWIKKQVGM
ncbi:MAG: citrate (Si)-synthase [Calditrichaeota bacterium]|nr:citrate (Si)-synthase [Calditrichota bacterium]